MRKVIAVTGIVAWLLVACSSGHASTRAPATGPRTYTVELDAGADDFNAEVTRFFPASLKVHPGDRVRFTVPRFHGEPHAVAFGSLVTDAVRRGEQLGAGATIAAQENSRELLAIPNIFPHVFAPGARDANQSAAHPCYLDQGRPPVSLTGGAPACAPRRQPAFTGTHAFYNGGALNADGASFTLRVSKRTALGTYPFMCLNHRLAMTGSLQVVAPTTAIPSPAAATARGRRDQARVIARLRTVEERIARGTPDNAFIGGGDPNVDPIFYTQVTEFGPRTLSVPVDGTVTWHMSGFHSLSFNAKDSDVGSLFPSAGGNFVLNTKGGPVGFPTPREAFVLPPPDDGKPMTIDGGTWDGIGFRSTGIVQSLPPITFTIKQTFTRAGTITYRCLVHSDMKGTIRVG